MTLSSQKWIEEPPRQAFLLLGVRGEASQSRLVDKSILPILSYCPLTGGVCSHLLYACSPLSAPVQVITGIFHTRIFLIFHSSANMTIRTARPDRSQQFRPRIHCLKKVGGYHHHRYYYLRGIVII